MKNKGFSLIELLVVISVIGVLATIALASFGGATDSGKDAQIKAYAKQIQSLMLSRTTSGGLLCQKDWVPDHHTNNTQPKNKELSKLQENIRKISPVGTEDPMGEHYDQHSDATNPDSEFGLDCGGDWGNVHLRWSMTFPIYEHLEEYQWCIDWEGTTGYIEDGNANDSYMSNNDHKCPIVEPS